MSDTTWKREYETCHQDLIKSERAYNELAASQERATESNRQLREELERVKKMNLFSETRMFDENARICRALAAAKEAIGASIDTLREGTFYDDYDAASECLGKLTNALVRIAECEKET